MKGACQAYIRNAGIAGLLYCIVPTIAYFLVMLNYVPEVRNVYFARLALSIVVGGALGAYINRFGVQLWLIRHQSAKGPGGVIDGALIGGGIGSGIALIPALTSLIGTNHPEQALTFITISWVAATAIGLLLGALFGAVGGKHVDREAA